MSLNLFQKSIAMHYFMLKFFALVSIILLYIFIICVRAPPSRRRSPFLSFSHTVYICLTPVSPIAFRRLFSVFLIFLGAFQRLSLQRLTRSYSLSIDGVLRRFSGERNTSLAFVPQVTRERSLFLTRSLFLLPSCSIPF